MEELVLEGSQSSGSLLNLLQNCNDGGDHNVHVLDNKLFFKKN